MTNIHTLNDALVKPSVEVIRRTLNIFILFDCSWSMEGKKIAAANQAMRESSNELKTVAGKCPEVDFQMRCIAFSDDARWHIGPDPVDIQNISWSDLDPESSTSTGAAIDLLAQTIRHQNMPRRGLPPVMVLMSDGANTDGNAYDQAINALNGEPWGAKAVRLSIGIGDNFNREQLDKFTNHPEIGVLEARNAVDLANYINYAVSTVAEAVSKPVSGSMAVIDANVELPALPAPTSQDSKVNLQVF